MRKYPGSGKAADSVHPPAQPKPALPAVETEGPAGAAQAAAPQRVPLRKGPGKIALKKSAEPESARRETPPPIPVPDDAPVEAPAPKQTPKPAPVAPPVAGATKVSPAAEPAPAPVVVPTKTSPAPAVVAPAPTHLSPSLDAIRAQVTSPSTSSSGPGVLRKYVSEIVSGTCAAAVTLTTAFAVFTPSNVVGFVGTLVAGAVAEGLVISSAISKSRKSSTQQVVPPVTQPPVQGNTTA